MGDERTVEEIMKPLENTSLLMNDFKQLIKRLAEYQKDFNKTKKILKAVLLQRILVK